MTRNTRQRLLDLVLVRLGWKETASRLLVDEDTLEGWLNGTVPIPDHKLLLLVQLIDQTGD